MSCCFCQKILPLCKVSVCGDIDFGITAQKQGLHKLELEFLGVIYNKFASFEVDEQIIFSASGLNENYTYTGKLYEPDGNLIVIQSGAVDYDCFSFQTTLSFQLTDETEGSN